MSFGAVNEVSSLRGRLVVFSLLAALGGSISSLAEAGRSFEQPERGVNRPGGDYRTIEFEVASPHLCYLECVGDSNCRAYTYVRPGVKGDKARCYLKDRKPEPVCDSCCISGRVNDDFGYPELGIINSCPEIDSNQSWHLDDTGDLALEKAVRGSAGPTMGSETADLRPTTEAMSPGLDEVQQESLDKADLRMEDRPDLVIDGFWISTYLSEDTIALKWLVRNVGKSSSPPSSLVVTCRQLAAVPCPWLDSSYRAEFKSLSPPTKNTSFERDFHSWEVVGMEIDMPEGTARFEFITVVDPHNSIRESDERNNSLTSNYPIEDDETVLPRNVLKSIERGSSSAASDESGLRAGKDSLRQARDAMAPLLDQTQQSSKNELDLGMAKPDLVVDKFWLRRRPTKKTSFYYWRVRNIGQVPSPATRLMVLCTQGRCPWPLVGYPMGGYNASVRALGPAAETIIKVEGYTISEDSEFELTATVDSKNSIKESDEGNNRLISMLPTGETVDPSALQAPESIEPANQ